MAGMFRLFIVTVFIGIVVTLAKSKKDHKIDSKLAKAKKEQDSAALVERKLQEVAKRLDFLENDIMEQDYTKPDSCKLEALGCFDDKVQRAMPEEILNERDTTSKVYGGRVVDWKNYERYLIGFACRCAKIARAKGFSVIGLQYYGECWSGPQAHKTYNKYGSTVHCIDGYFKQYSADKQCTNYIGQTWTNYVYRLGVTGCTNHNIEPVGCFHDDLHVPRPVPNYIMNERDPSAKGWNGHLIVWKKWATESSKMICRCAEAARKKEQNYFAIQFWGECWSGNDTDIHYDRNGVSDQCYDEDFRRCRCNSYNCVGMASTNYLYRFLPPLPSKGKK